MGPVSAGRINGCFSFAPVKKPVLCQEGRQCVRFLIFEKWMEVFPRVFTMPIQPPKNHDARRASFGKRKPDVSFCAKPHGDSPRARTIRRICFHHGVRHFYYRNPRKPIRAFPGFPVQYNDLSLLKLCCARFLGKSCDNPPRTQSSGVEALRKKTSTGKPHKIAP